MNKPAVKKSSVRTAVTRAHALQASGEEGLALEVLVKLVQANPADAAARSALADLLALQGRPAEAIESYEKALVLAPNSPAVLMSLARLYLRHREAAKAEEVLRRAVALKAGPEASLLLGELLKDKGSAAEAAPHLQDAASGRSGGDAHARMADGLTRFRANVKLGDFKEAFGEAETLLAASGTQDCIDSFFISPDQRELMPTLEALKAFSVKNPKSPWPHYFRATLLSNMGRGEEAIAETEKLTAAPKRYDWMRHKHGEILLTNRRDYAGAEKEYSAALKCVPGFWKARAALAEIALCRGKAAAAAKLTDQLIAEMPERSKTWGHAVRGKILLWSGDYAKALESLELAVAAGVPYSQRHRGAARLLLGRLDEAQADLDAGLSQGVDAEGLTWRGELRRLRGDLKGALEDLNAAVRMDGANSFWALADRALAKSAAGDAPAAWADFSMIRRDVLDRFEKAAGRKAKSPEDADGVRSVLEAGLTLGRGVRVSNEYLFPVWMSHGDGA
jgi:tetratricopeptide (TPR) repeat protein